MSESEEEIEQGLSLLGLNRSDVQGYQFEPTLGNSQRAVNLDESDSSDAEEANNQQVDMKDFQKERLGNTDWYVQCFCYSVWQVHLYNYIKLALSNETLLLRVKFCVGHATSTLSNILHVSPIQ